MRTAGAGATADAVGVRAGAAAGAPAGGRADAPSDALSDALRGVSVVVPVGPGDGAWAGLLLDVLPVLPGADVVLAGAEPRPAGVPDAGNVRWVVAPRGRARQLNAGAAAARGEWLWFLHADSRLDASTLPALARAVGAARPAGREAVYYADLAFLPDGPRLMHLNALGAWLRSRWGKMPFGDQGLCVPRALFERLGGFDPAAPYGEDHLFVWHARQAGAAVRPTGGRLWTSARRYRDAGWLRTTARHVRLTARQAWPEWRKLRGA